MTSQRALRVIAKPFVFAASLGPLAYLIWAALTGHLSVNPLSDLTNETGVWALRFICISLAVTPLRRLTGWNPIIRFRRMMGLFAFFYGTLHFLIYVIVDRFAGLDFPEGMASLRMVRDLAASVAADIYKRPFITIGFSTWVILLPLAITSTAGMIRRLGGRRWNALHRLAYLAGVTAVVHYYWLVKADISRPVAYGTVVALLLGFRVYWWRMKTAASPVRVQQPAAARRA
jgi:sulfoxide reductase heme-binding subunit YedZ